MAEIYEKGIVVLPKSMRDALHMLPGTKVAFRLENDGIKVVPAAGVFEEMEKFRAKNAVYTTKELNRIMKELDTKRHEELMKDVY